LVELMLLVSGAGATLLPPTLLPICFCHFCCSCYAICCQLATAAGAGALYCAVALLFLLYSCWRRRRCCCCCCCSAALLFLYVVAALIAAPALTCFTSLLSNVKLYATMVSRSKILKFRDSQQLNQFSKESGMGQEKAVTRFPFSFWASSENLIKLEIHPAAVCWRALIWG
jgi:hypothetical protein